MNQLRGIQDLIPFLNWLDGKKVWYTLHHLRDDSIMVAVTIVGERIEIDFFSDHIEYSRFKGDESVEEDQAVLFELIEDFTRD